MNATGESSDVQKLIKQINEEEEFLLTIGNQEHFGRASGELASLYGDLKKKAQKQSIIDYAVKRQQQHENNARDFSMFPPHFNNNGAEGQRAVTPPVGVRQPVMPPPAPMKAPRNTSKGGKRRNKTNKRKVSRRRKASRRAATQRR
jgi:hypothetical protein